MLDGDAEGGSTITVYPAQSKYLGTYSLKTQHEGFFPSYFDFLFLKSIPLFSKRRKRYHEDVMRITDNLIIDSLSSRC